MIEFPIFLDNHSTTKVDERVVEAMLPYFTKHYGNSSSRQHSFGWHSDIAVENSRRIISQFINCESSEIIFTSGSTESNNLALKGTLQNTKKHFITCVTEHPSIIDVANYLEKNGVEVTYLTVNKFGEINLDELKNAIKDNTILVSLMTVNNEIGTIHNIEAIGKICKEKKILFHTDATQGIGKIKIDVKKMNIDLMSFSSHKIYGPKGVGALYVKKNVNLVPLFHGGGHEKKHRSGTLNVSGIVGFGKAIDIFSQNMEEENLRIKNLQQILHKKILENISNVWLNGSFENRVPNNLNVGIENIDANNVMMQMKEVAISTGSACASISSQESHVLKAIGLSKNKIHSSLRFGIGRFNTEEEINYVSDKLSEIVKKTRKNFKN